MRLFHERWRRRTSLLASEALEGRERAAAQAHVERCERCREELASLREVLELVAADPVRTAGPELPLSVLVARVQEALDRPEGRPVVAPSPPRLAWAVPLRSATAAAAAVFALLAVLHAPGPRPAPRLPGPPEAALEPSTASADILDRMEGHVARQHAARYLNEAQDVLVTVAATAPDCDRATGRVDVGEEARRSRDLLARRALLVEMDREEVASVRPVLDDVEEMLREVASLESCARRGDLEAIHRELARRRLLMKIDLMTRELQG